MGSYVGGVRAEVPLNLPDYEPVYISASCRLDSVRGNTTPRLMKTDLPSEDGQQEREARTCDLDSQQSRWILLLNESQEEESSKNTEYVWLSRSHGGKDTTALIQTPISREEEEK